jgi:hypothetical protein
MRDLKFIVLIWEEHAFLEISLWEAQAVDLFMDTAMLITKRI